MEFRAVILLLTLYFIRPQDWVPGMAGMNVAKPVMLLGIFGMLNRNRKSVLNPSAPMMAMPHEWIMVIYAAYILLASGDNMKAVASDVLPKVFAFFLTLHSLTSLARMESFLKWWRWSLVAVTVMGVGALAGVDFTASLPIMEWSKGRLALNTWMLNNANALGHTLITLLPLLYFGVIKDRPMTRWLFALPPAAMACWCLWSTQSKGAYLVGALLIVFSLLLGRPWWLKISILALAMGLGSSALSVLPRMNEMGRLRGDEGVVGRMMAWEMARNVTRNTLTGEGYQKFFAIIKWDGKALPKATHSAYVQTGGDLGLPGLLLYMSVLCCGLRTMVTFHGVSKELNRVRGALFCLLLGYMASGWMINRSYHLELFLVIGAIAAYQRLCLRTAAALPAKSTERVALAQPAQMVKRKMAPDPRALKRHLGKWRRYGLLDAGMAFAALQVVLVIWDYVLASF